MITWKGMKYIIKTLSGKQNLYPLLRLKFIIPEFDVGWPLMILILYGCIYCILNLSLI